MTGVQTCALPIFERGVNGSYFWQFTHHIRPGYVGIEATSSDAAVLPVAFMSPDSKAVVVIVNNGPARTAEFCGLPADTYAVTRTSKVTKEYCKEAPAVVVNAAEASTVALPPQSVTTLTAVKD